MKKLLIAAASFIALTSSALASPGTNARAAKHLTEEFKDAKNITWTSTKDFTKATFEWNKQLMNVFYNDLGEYIATSRTVTMQMLPIESVKFIEKKYKDYKLTESFEVTKEESDTNYFVALVKGNTKVILKISPLGDVSVFKS
jgi:opacity protein-like surface antigen